MITEMVGEEEYRYVPLGEYIVMAPAMCGGRPTFKYTRLEVSMILTLLQMGDTVDQVVTNYAKSNLTHAAVYEALSLAQQSFMRDQSVICRLLLDCRRRNRASSAYHCRNPKLVSWASHPNTKRIGKNCIVTIVSSGNPTTRLFVKG